MTSTTREYHLLVIEDRNGKRTIHLDAATYSIGRDKNNAIVVESPGISRQHALLLRLPKPEGQGYHYRIVDGNAQGRLSANGMYLNGERLKTHNLTNGDRILLANEVKLDYQVVTMEQAEFIKYLDQTKYQSIKSAPRTSTETLVSESLEVEPTLFRKELNPDPTPAPATKSATPTPAPEKSFFASEAWQKYGLVGTGGVVAGVVLGGLLLWGLGVFSSSDAPPPEPPSQTQPN